MDIIRKFGFHICYPRHFDTFHPGGCTWWLDSWLYPNWWNMLANQELLEFFDCQQNTSRSECFWFRLLSSTGSFASTPHIAWPSAYQTVSSTTCSCIEHKSLRYSHPQHSHQRQSSRETSSPSWCSISCTLSCIPSLSGCIQRSDSLLDQHCRRSPDILLRSTYLSTYGLPHVLHAWSSPVGTQPAHCRGSTDILKVAALWSCRVLWSILGRCCHHSCRRCTKHHWIQMDCLLWPL